MTHVENGVASRTLAEKSDPNADALRNGVMTTAEAQRLIYEDKISRYLMPGTALAFGDALTFRVLRGSNLARCPLFKNAKGEIKHSGRDWSLNDWYTATSGELGEAGNILKKIRRGDMTLHEAKPMLARELADVVIYLDLLAAEAGIDLDQAVLETFNAKSAQLELDLFMTPRGFVREHRD